MITVKCPAKPKGRNQQSKMSRGQTLVVVPTVALRQWQSEILRFTKEGHLSISVYHGNSRGQLTQVSNTRISCILLFCRANLMITKIRRYYLSEC